MLDSIRRALRIPRRLREDGPIFDRVAAMQFPDTCDTCHQLIQTGHYAVKHYSRIPGSDKPVHIGTTCAHDFGLRITLPRHMRESRRRLIPQSFSLPFSRRIS